MLQAAVIGLGRIGQGYDYEQTVQDKTRVLTHAFAYAQHPAFNLVAGVDTCDASRKAFSKKFNAPAYDSVTELFEFHELEVVSICVPTAQHAQIFNELTVFEPKVILMEKPIALDPSTASEIVQRARQAKIQLFLNYIRNKDPGFLAMKKALLSGQLGRPQKGTIWYSGNVGGNAIHYIHLVNSLMGPITKVVNLNEPRGTDFKLITPTASIYCLHQVGEGFVSEFELITTQGKLRYYQDGHIIAFYPFVNDSHFPRVQTLAQDPAICFQTDFARYQYHVLEDIFRTLQGQTDNQQDIIRALQSESILFELMSTIEDISYA